MLTGKPIFVLTAIIVLYFLPVLGYGGEIADGKIKNGQLLMERALAAAGDQKTDYTYKAKREFERASLAEPENPWPIYWNSVLTFYLESDSLGAAKQYQKALKSGPEALANYPSPWLYKNDKNVKSAIKGDFAWTKEKVIPEEKAPSIPSIPAETTKAIIPVTAANPLDTLKLLIQNQDYVAAESLHKALSSIPEYDTSLSLDLLGLELRLNQDSIKQATDILEKILATTKKGSPTAKSAITLYDKSLDTLLAQAKMLERKGQFAEAKTVLERAEPNRLIPASDARGRLLLQHASVFLALNDPDGADSILHTYLTAGYKKDNIYNNVKDRLTIVQNQRKASATQLAQAEIKTEPKPQPKTEQFITVLPPNGNILKVIVNSIDPATGRIQDSKLWETTGPLKLKTGTAYKLTVQRKHEKKAPLFIAAAGIIATFLVVR